MSGKIFISYRRDDASAWARLLYDRLFQHFSQNEIFMDVDTIEPGVDFVEAIEEVVGACDVLIAVIGSRWLTSSDRAGRRRLDTPDDFVRLEIAIALKRGIRVVPVLVEGATIPEVGELPDDVKALVRRHAVEIGHNRFNADSERLVDAIKRVFEKAEAERKQSEEKERLAAQQGQKEYLEVEALKRAKNERLEAEQRERKQREEEERLTPEQRERERLEAERREREEKERLEAERCARDNLEAQQSERGRLEQEISQPQEKELLVHSKLTPLVTIVIFRIASVGCILGGIFLALIFIPHIGDRDAFAPVAVTVAIASLLGFWGIYIWKSILKK